MDADERKDAVPVGWPKVRIIRVLYNREPVEHEVYAPMSVIMALHDRINGGEVRRCRILWGDTNARDWDMSL